MVRRHRAHYDVTVMPMTVCDITDTSLMAEGLCKTLG